MGGRDKTLAPKIFSNPLISIKLGSKFIRHAPHFLALSLSLPLLFSHLTINLRGKICTNPLLLKVKTRICALRLGWERSLFIVNVFTHSLHGRLSRLWIYKFVGPLGILGSWYLITGVRTSANRLLTIANSRRVKKQAFDSAIIQTSEAELILWRNCRLMPYL